MLPKLLWLKPAMPWGCFSSKPAQQPATEAFTESVLRHLYPCKSTGGSLIFAFRRLMPRGECRDPPTQRILNVGKRAPDSMLFVRVVEREMEQAIQDRRMMRRFDMRLPAAVRVAGRSSNEFFTETQNVSARGVFFYIDRALAPGTQLSVTLTFPPHITLTEAVRVRFTARVIRVDEPLPSARIGIAAAIEDYEFLPTAAPRFGAALPPESRAH